MFFNQPLIPIIEALDPHSGSVGVFDDMFRNSGKEDHEDDNSAGKSNSHSGSVGVFAEMLQKRDEEEHVTDSIKKRMDSDNTGGGWKSPRIQEVD